MSKEVAAKENKKRGTVLPMKNFRFRNKAKGKILKMNPYQRGPADRISPLLTDFYEVTMALNYFEQGRHNEQAIFDVFFRKNPFKGEYTIFAGLKDVLNFIKNYEITKDEAYYLCSNLKIAQNEKEIRSHGFYKYLIGLKNELGKLKIHAMDEGVFAFPRVPVMKIEGPLGLCQLMETPILNLTGFASLVATNAYRMCRAVTTTRKLGESIQEKSRGILEFGLRRAQGPDGGMTASKYAVVGGFVATSNCLAGFKEGIRISGTMAHSFICGYQGLTKTSLQGTITTHGVDINAQDFFELVLKIKDYCLKANFLTDNKPLTMDPNKTELLAFVAYATTFPENFLALVDTYDTINSGVPNFLFVSAALEFAGHKSRGIRLDSGDLKQLSIQTRGMFARFEMNLDKIYTAIVAAEKSGKLPGLKRPTLGSDPGKRYLIVASNDLNEDKLRGLFKDYENSKPPNQCQIDLFGVGTHLATCQNQPALGMVYKLVESNGKPCVKFSNEPGKQTLPGSKEAYRLYVGKEGERKVVADILLTKEEVPNLKKDLPNCLWSSNQQKKTTLAVRKIAEGISKSQGLLDFDFAENLYKLYIPGKKKTPFEDALNKSLNDIKEVVNLQKDLFTYDNSKTSPKDGLHRSFLDTVKADKKVPDVYKVLYSEQLVAKIGELDRELRHQ